MNKVKDSRNMHAYTHTLEGKSDTDLQPVEAHLVNVEVLEPKWLRDKVKKEIQKMT